MLEFKWSIGNSGFSIIADDGLGTIVRKYSGSNSQLDEARFISWLDYAERVCALHNAFLKPLEKVKMKDPTDV
jgi:hypothetical protein